MSGDLERSLTRTPINKPLSLDRGLNVKALDRIFFIRGLLCLAQVARPFIQRMAWTVMSVTVV